PFPTQRRGAPGRVSVSAETEPASDCPAVHRELLHPGPVLDERACGAVDIGIRLLLRTRIHDLDFLHVRIRKILPVRCEDDGPVYHPWPLDLLAESAARSVG